MPDYILDYALKKGIYNNYRVVLEKNNFLKHQKNKAKWWYQLGAYNNFLENLIPKTFEESDCICPSNSKKWNELCVYSINKQIGDYITYLKIAFIINKRKKVITVKSYNIFPNISEIICQQKMKKLIDSKISS